MITGTSENWALLLGVFEGSEPHRHSLLCTQVVVQIWKMHEQKQRHHRAMHSSAAVISNSNLFKNAANDFIIPSCVPVAYAPRCWLFWWLHFTAGGAMSRIGIVKNFRATVYKFICEFQSEFKECRDIIFAICGHRVMTRLPLSSSVLVSQSMPQTTGDWNILICNYTSTTLLNGQLQRMGNRFHLHPLVPQLTSIDQIHFLW